MVSRSRTLHWRRLGSIAVWLVAIASFGCTLAVSLFSLVVVALAGGGVGTWLVTAACLAVVVIQLMVGNRVVIPFARRLWTAG